MKTILIVVILLTGALKMNAQGNIKASDIIRVEDPFVSCDYEILASFPGGLNRFNQYLMKNIHYPVSAVKSNVHGKVVLDFIVEKNGRIDAIKIVKSVSPDIDTEAIKVLKNSPKWNPTKDCGKAVRTQYRIPIDFQLPKNSQNSKIYTAVEQEPEFPGGMAAFNRYFLKSLKLVENPNENIKTRLTVEFVVEKDGSLSNIKILKSISPATDQSAIDLLKQSPKWIPGKFHNETVRVRYAIPIILEPQSEDQ